MYVDGRLEVQKRTRFMICMHHAPRGTRNLTYSQTITTKSAYCLSCGLLKPGVLHLDPYAVDKPQDRGIQKGVLRYVAGLTRSLTEQVHGIQTCLSQICFALKPRCA